MKEPKWKWLDFIGDGLLAGVLAAVILLVYMIMSLGCATTCPPCQPTIETVEVEVPVYSCPEPPQMPALALPALPDPPIPEVDEEGLKSWYAQVASLVKAREKIFLEYVKSLESILQEYRPTPP